MLKMNFNRKYNSGFSLIELMIVIAIIGILVAVALPQFAAMTEDAKKTKAKQDCDTIAQAIQKFNSLEGSTVEKLMDLKGKYLTNIDTLKDPWGNSYDMDASKGIVFSKGPDSKSSYGVAKNGTAKDDKDNIIVNYIGALTIVDAKIEVNPKGGSLTNTEDANKTYDVLHLYFNKAVSLAESINFKKVATTEYGNVPSKDSGLPAGSVFRFYEGGANKIMTAPPKPTDVSGAVELPEAVSKSTAADGTFTNAISLDESGTEANTWGYGADSKEIVIRLPNKCTGVIIPGTHYINLYGGKNNPNPTFIEYKVATTDPTKGAEAAGTAVQIKNFD